MVKQKDSMYTTKQPNIKSYRPKACKMTKLVKTDTRVRMLTTKC